MAKSWYVVHTYSGYEEKVRTSIEEQLKASGNEQLVDEILIPAEEMVEIKGGKKRISTRKNFPSYVLIHMEMNEESWHLVKNVPKVTGFLGDPTPLPDAEADAIKLQREEAKNPKPIVLFEKGENVRVIEGPFSNFTGVIDDVNQDRGKLRVMVNIFGRATPVELEFLQVEKV